MPYTTLNQNYTILRQLTSNDGQSIVNLYTPNPNSIKLSNGESIASVNCFLKSLRAYTQIKSITASPLPEFTLEDSESVRLSKTLSIEWDSARVHLDCLLSNNGGLSWHKVGSISLLNTQGYPFRSHNLLDLYTDALFLELGQNSSIGVQVKDVGHGILADTDTLTISGSYTEEYIIHSPDPVVFNNNYSPTNLRAIASYITNALTANTAQDAVLPLPKSFVVTKAKTNYPARVRLYSSVTAREADRTRAKGVAYTGAGLLLEVIHDATILETELSPTVFGSILDSSNGIPAIIENLDTVSRQVTLTTTYVTLEV